MTDPTEGELIFERLKDLNFPPLQPLRKSFGVASERIPDTVAEALISAGPYIEPALSQEERGRLNADLVLAVQATFDTLTEEEQWIYHMLVEVGLSMRFVARTLNIPKTTFARQRDELAKKIRNELLKHEVVRDKLGL